MIFIEFSFIFPCKSVRFNYIILNMKNTFFLILFLSSFISAEELIFQCEDGYSYKIENHQKSTKQAFFKNKTSDWVSVKRF